MSHKLEFKGKDIDEAINKACSKFHAPSDELDIEIVSTGSSGIFGLCKKQAVIRARRKISEAETKPVEKQSPPKQSSQAQQSPPAPSQPEPVSEPLPAAPEAEKTEKVSTAPAEKKPAREPRKKPKEEKPNLHQPKPVATLTPEILEQIKTDLTELLNLMGFPSEVQIEDRKNKAHVTITGDHIDELTGNDGQALDSIQYLMRKIIGKKFPEKIMFSIDAGEFREKRKSELQELAVKLAAEVKETEKTRTIPPLNPSERRIVHLALQDDKTIRSRSVGEGLFKKILIYLPGKGRQSGPRKKGRKKSEN